MVKRYIRLTNLIPDLLKMVDEKQIAMSPAVELSHLPKKQQEVLLDTCNMQQCTPSLSQAARLKTLQLNSQLTDQMLVHVMSEQKCQSEGQMTLIFTSKTAGLTTAAPISFPCMCRTPRSSIDKCAAACSRKIELSHAVCYADPEGS